MRRGKNAAAAGEGGWSAGGGGGAGKELLNGSLPCAKAPLPSKWIFQVFKFQVVGWNEGMHGGSLSELNSEFEVLRGSCTTQLVKEKGQSTSSTNEALP